jgi:hypothetical protein
LRMNAAAATNRMAQITVTMNVIRAVWFPH